MPSRKKGDGEDNKGWFQVGNSGRAKKFTSPEELEEHIEAYFEECDSNTSQKIVGKEIKTVADPLPYTIEGLCVALNVDRDTLMNYQKKKGYEPFFGIIKEAKRKVPLGLQQSAGYHYL